MITTSCPIRAKALLIPCAALALAACGSNGHYRIASVGDVPGTTADAGSGSGGDTSTSTGTSTGTSAGTSTGTSAGTAMAANGGGAAASGTGSSGTGAGGGSASGTDATTAGSTRSVAGPVLVSAGNAVIGVSGRNRLATAVNGALPATTPVTGTVTAILRKTGQTLVELGNGQSVVLNKAGGTLGQVVALDLGSRTVVAAPSGSSLLGVGVASATLPRGSLAGVNVASGGTDASGGVIPTAVNAVTTVAANPTGIAQTVLPAAQATVPTVSAIVPTVTAPVAGIIAGVGVVAGGSTTVTPGNTSATGKGLLGARGLLGTTGR